MKESINHVNISTFKKMLRPAYEARIPMLAIGHKGIGKSEVVKQFAAEHNLDFIDIRLAYLEAQDIVGFPYRDEATGRMLFAAPDWLPLEGKGILFLDEINRARIDVLQAVFQLVRDREIGGITKNGTPYRLPEGYSIVAAMNPDTPDGEYLVTQMDGSLYDRFVKVAVKAELSDFRRYVKTAGRFHETLKAFILGEELLLSDTTPPEVEVDATPRGFEMFGKLISVLHPDEHALIQPLGEGVIGKTNTTAYILFSDNYYQEISEFLDAIIHNYTNNPLLRDQIKQKSTGESDFIISLRDRFINHYLADSKRYRELIENGGLRNFITYIFSLSDEYIVAHLIAIREGFGKEREGLYLTDILSIINGDPLLEERYNLLIEGKQESRLGNYI